MSLQRTVVRFIVLMSALAVCSHASAQHLENFARRHQDNSDFSNLYDPLCEVDANWFEPIDCECPVERPLNSGWFFGYSRMHINISRPRNQPQTLFWDPGAGASVLPSIFTGNESSEYDGDWAWGNRFDFGWTSEDGTGLWFVARKLDDPKRRLDYDNIDINNDESNRFDGEQWGPTFVTLNGFSMWAFEANKVWRLDPTPKGAIMEPFFGPRYMKVRDHSDRNDVFRVTPFDVFGPTGPANTTEIERLSFNYRQSVITTDNDLFGGQFGMRTRWRRGRWQITSDLRALAFWNHQIRETIGDNEIQQQDFTATYNAAGNIVGNPAAVGGVLQVTDQNTTYESHNTFVYGGELNVQAAFEITNGFAAVMSSEMMALGDGIGRGYTGTDDSLVLLGFSFGFTINR